MKSIFSIIGLVASSVCILLCLIFLFWNPYSSIAANRDTIGMISFMLILPACLGLIAAWLRIPSLMYIVVIWSVPYGLYLSIASVPSLWNIFGIVLLLYFISAHQMRKQVISSLS